MKKIHLYLLLFTSVITQAQITLTHNVGTNLIQTSMYTCPGGNIEWARAFVLEDFGISTNEEFVITLGEVGFSEVGVWDVNITFNIFEIDNDFPASFSEDNLIGSSETIRIYQSGFQLVILEFESPVVVPSHVERILVEVRQESTTSSAITFIAGTALDNDYSWFHGCGEPIYITTEDLNRPDARYYINVTGEKFLAIDEEKNKFFTIHPNPVKDILRIDNSSTTEITSIKLYDVLGRLVMALDGDVEQIDVSHLNSGLLFVEIETDQGVMTMKIIKE